MKQTLIALCLTALISIALNGAGNAQQTQVKGGKQSTNNNRMTNIEDLIDRYFDSLNETDGKRRLSLTRQVWTEKGKFGTPYGEVEGHDAIVALVAKVQKQFPGAKVRRTGKIDGFGDYLRWSFTLSQADGKPILGGVDFAIIVDGKLQSVMGFFDFAPNPANQ
jgi:hypothetical protein